MNPFKGSNTELVQALFLEILIGALISLGGLGTLMPNLLEGIGELGELGKFKALQSFALAYFILPLFIFSIYWVTRGEKLLLQSIAGIFDKPPEKGPPELSVEDENNALIIVSCKEDKNDTEEGPRPKILNKSYRSHQAYSVYIFLLFSIQALPIICFVNRQFSVIQSMTLWSAIVILCGGLKILIVGRHLNMLTDPEKIRRWPIICSISTMVCALDLLYLIGMIIFLKPWYMYTDRFYWIVTWLSVTGILFYLFCFMRSLRMDAIPWMNRFLRFDSKKHSFFNLKKLQWEDEMILSALKKVMIHLYIIFCLIQLIFFLNKTSANLWVIVIFSIFWTLFYSVIAGYQFKKADWRSMAIQHGAIVIAVMSMTIGSLIIFLDYRPNHVYPTIRKKFAVSRLHAATKSPDDKLFIIRLDSNQKKIVSPDSIHRLNTSNQRKDIAQLERIKEEQGYWDIKTAFYKTYLTYEPYFPKEKGTYLPTIDGDTLFNLFEKNYNRIEKDLVSKRLYTNPDFDKYWIYRHPINFYGYYLQTYKTQYENAVKAEKKVEEIYQLLILSEGDRQLAFRKFNDLLVETIRSNALSEESIDRLKRLLARHPDNQVALEYNIQLSQVDSADKVTILGTFIDGIIDSRDLFQNPQFKEFVENTNEALGNYYRDLESTFLLSKIPGQLDKLKEYYDHSDELQEIKDILAVEYITLNTIQGLHRFHKNYSSHKLRQYRERYGRAQKIYQSYLFEIQMGGVFVYLIFAIGLSLILYFIRQLSINVKRDLGLDKEFRNAAGLELGVCLVVGLLLLAPLLTPVKPENIDPEKPYWMMSLKNWYLPGVPKPTFHPTIIEDEYKAAGGTKTSRAPQLLDNEMDYSQSFAKLLEAVRESNQHLDLSEEHLGELVRNTKTLTTHLGPEDE